MTLPEFFLICFGIGTLWAVMSLLLGGLHFGHFGHHHAPVSVAKVLPGHGHSHSHTSGAHMPGWIASLLNPSVLAVFFAWFGGTGYLLSKYSGLFLWINLAIAAAFGMAGGSILLWFMRWLMQHERVLNPAEYDMVGVLGRVSSTIRADGVGEVIYLRDGIRRSFCARSDSAVQIARGEEVIVTHFDKGIGYVRTWDAMTQTAKEIGPGNIA